MFNINIIYYLIYFNSSNLKFFLVNIIVNPIFLIFLIFFFFKIILIFNKHCISLNQFVFNSLFILSFYKLKKHNIGLFNILGFWHPYLFFFCILLYLNSFFYTSRNNIILMLITIILGSFWSTQEVLWLDWWNWDGVEQSLIVLFLLLFLKNHFKKKPNSKINFYLCNIFLIYFIINKTNIFKSIHSFTNSTISNISYVYIYILISILLIVCFNLRKYFLFKIFFIYNITHFIIFVLIKITYNYNIYYNQLIFKKMNFLIIFYIVIFYTKYFYKIFLIKHFWFFLILYLYTYILKNPFYKKISVKHLLIFSIMIVFINNVNTNEFLLKKNNLYFYKKINLNLNNGFYFLNINNKNIGLETKYFYFLNNFFKKINYFFSNVYSNEFFFSLNTKLSFLCKNKLFLRYYWVGLHYTIYVKK